MHPPIVLATMTTPLAMIVILNTMLCRPLLKFMDERNDSIKNDGNKVKENSQEMLRANDEVKAIHMSIREEIHKIKQDTINVAKEETQQVIKAKEEELERKMASLYTELVSQKEELQDHLSAHLSDPEQALQNNIKQH